MNNDRISRPSLKSAISGKRKAVTISSDQLISTELFRPEQTLPLIIRSALKDADLITWANSNQEFLATRILEHGGILFRDFNIASIDEFEQLVKAVSGDLLEYTYRSTPRSAVTGKIYTSTEYPADQFIPLHNEMAYSSNWPLKIWFYSMVCAEEGGETPIADSRKIYEHIDSEIRARFIQKQVMYVRNYRDVLDLPWQTVFQTSSKAEVERYCQSVGIKFEWKNQDHLRTYQVCPAVVRHPATNQLVWFNQAHLFHVSSLPPIVREALLGALKEEDLPRHAYYGDGSPIEDAVIEAIHHVYQQYAIAFPWQTGDILMLDNMLVAHGRAPFKGSRRVVVGMAEPISNQQIPSG